MPVLFARRGIIPLSIIFIVFFFIGTAYFYSYHEKKTTLQLDDPSDHPFQLTGFRYESRTETGPYVSIESDAIKLSKKKIGFFRFGLVNELTVSNVKIVIKDPKISMQSNQPGIKPASLHETSKSDPKTRKPKGHDVSSPAPRTVPGASAEGSSVANRQPNIANRLKQFSIPKLPVKRVAAIRLVPVEISYFQDRETAVKLSAASAEIRPTRGALVFKGSVKVVSGNRTLKTDRLSYDVVLNRMVSNTGIYTRGQTHKRLEKAHTFDLFLNNITTLQNDDRLKEG